MSISEEKTNIVINNYFKTECSIDTTIREAFEKGFRLGMKKVKAIENAPTIDAVEVVRCRDCKNWQEWENGTGSCHRSENGYNWFGVDATDYCSFGVRRKDGEA